MQNTSETFGTETMFSREDPSVLDMEVTLRSLRQVAHTSYFRPRKTFSMAMTGASKTMENTRAAVYEMHRFPMEK